MKTKKVCFSELAYVFGTIFLAIGTALMEKANFGMSMVVAPAYLIHLKVSTFLDAYTFGMSEYIFQAFVLVLMCLCIRRFKVGYLFSFATAVVYGFALDGAMWLFRAVPADTFLLRGLYYVLGMVLCSVGVAFFFRTYIAPAAYELFVKEFSARYAFGIGVTKTVYDVISCLVGVVLSFAFFGFGTFEGVKLGTVLCALVNGGMISFISKKLDTFFEFRDALPLRRIFEK